MDTPFKTKCPRDSKSTPLQMTPVFARRGRFGVVPPYKKKISKGENCVPQLAKGVLPRGGKKRSFTTMTTQTSTSFQHIPLYVYKTPEKMPIEIPYTSHLKINSSTSTNQSKLPQTQIQGSVPKNSISLDAKVPVMETTNQVENWPVTPIRKSPIVCSPFDAPPRKTRLINLDMRIPFPRSKVDDMVL